MMGAREVPGVVLLGGAKTMGGMRGMVDMESMPGVWYLGCLVLVLILGILLSMIVFTQSGQIVSVTAGIVLQAPQVIVYHQIALKIVKI